MISGEDIDAFRDQNAEALSTAEAFVRRCERGIPPDRWATTRGMYHVAKAIRAYQQIVAWQTETIEELAEAIERGSRADR